MATVGDYIGLALILALAYAIYQGFHNSGDVKQALSEKKKELKVCGVTNPGQRCQHLVRGHFHPLEPRCDGPVLVHCAYALLTQDATQKKFTEGGQYLAEHSNALKFGKQSE